MTAKLHVDVVQTSSEGPVTLTKQSAAKCWVGVVSTNGVGMDNSLNVSTQTDQGTGDFDYTLTNNAASQMDEYAFAGMGGGGDRVVRCGSSDTTSSVFDAKLHNQAGTLTDFQHGWMWIGDLA